MPTLVLTTPDLWLNGPGTVRSVWSPMVSGLPTGAIINSVTLSFYNGHTYASPGYSEVFWGTEPLVAQRLWYYHRGTPNKTITLDLTGKVTGNGTFSLLFYKTKNDEGSNSNVCFQNVSVVIDYTNPRSTFTLDKTALDAGTALGVNISRIDASYTHKVTFAFGSRSYTATGVGTSTSYTIPVAWLDQIPNAVSGTGSVKVETLDSSGASMGAVSASITITAGAGIVPTVGAITATLLDGLDGLYIQGHSKCRVAVSGYTAGTGATVASVLISGNGDSAWAESMVSSLLRTPGTVTFTVTIKDSRAREASGSISITVEAYTDIAITGRTALRCLSDGTVSRTKGKSAKLGCSYAMTAVGSNAATVRVYWRVYGTEAWTEITGWDSASGYTAVALTDAVALDERYEILFRVADKVTVAEQTAVIAPGSVFMVWSKIRNAFGFGTYPTGEKQVAIAEDWSLMLGQTNVGNALKQRSRVRNLLDNSDFRNPVNQRGQTSYTEHWGYTIDRWYLSSGDSSGSIKATVTLTDGGLKFTPSSEAADRSALVQRLPQNALRAGVDYTFVAKKTDGDYLFGGIEDDTASYGFWQVALFIDTEVTLEWAALYEGAYDASTLPPYVPKENEIVSCREYYREYGDDGIYCYCYINDYLTGFDFDIPMRIAPSILECSILRFNGFESMNVGDSSIMTAKGVTYIHCPGAVAGEWYRITSLKLDANL